MNNRQLPVQRCLCDGRYDGCTHGKRCEEPAAGQLTSKYFCGVCNQRRLAHIDAGFRKLNERRGGAR